jgi:peptide/nickel transport system substrate-binding protein
MMVKLALVVLPLRYLKTGCFMWLFSLVLFANPALAAQLIEPPSLIKQVESGALPPIESRVPKDHATVDFTGTAKKAGRYGGELRLLMGKQKDTRMITVYGYARLISLDEKLRFVPDILKKFEVREGREFTFYLRSGHRWSDGAPFTAEDFRYFWEDIATNEKVSPGGLPKALMVDNKPPKFEVIDETTIRYTWDKPNREFIPSIAGPRPLAIYRPAHYLKKYHAKYADMDEIQALITAERKRDWVDLHSSRARWYRMDNIDLPTLQPWRNTTRPPAVRFVFTRNPFYHRVDMNGRQLPYIDRVMMALGEVKVIPAKSGSGDADLQARYLRLDHYTFLKEGEQRFDYTVHLWKRTQGAHMALYPNLNTADPEWRGLMRDVRFRRALSLAIDRHEINQVIYYGLASEGNNTILPASPLFQPHLQTDWAKFDIKRANALLDDMGLIARNDDGIRLMKSGRPLIITIDTAGESTVQIDVLELIHDSWLKAGIKVFTKPSQREVFRQRIVAGQTVMSVWSGISNGIPTASMSPEELAPTSKYQLNWPKWGMWGQSNGRMGEKPDMPKVTRLFELYRSWLRAGSDEEQVNIWREMLNIQAEQVFSIGIVNSTQQPVLVNNALRNVPRDGFYSWNPGAYFGVYKPDTFWYAAK